MLRLASLVALPLSLSLVACSDDTTATRDSAPPAPDAAADIVRADAGTDLPATDQLTADGGTDGAPTDSIQTGDGMPKGLQPGWNVIYPGGKTICSRGDKYMFAVHPGTVNKLVVDFEGGGACWTALTCSITNALFKERAEDSLKYIQQGYSEGIYDKQNTDNPFKDWYHVFVPYCTGDIHWGNAVHTYGSGAGAFSINHKGAENVKAVLAWIYGNFSAPEKIFVTGCSAGAYGSLMWSAYLIDHYPSAKVYQFGDSGAGVITANFLKDSFPNWNALSTAPTWIPGLDPSKVDLLSKDIGYIYRTAATFYPQQRFSQYNTLFDKTQVTYFQVMGGGTEADWSKTMVQSIDDIIKGAAGFRAFVIDGKKHCIIPYNELYTYALGNRRLVDWLRDMVDDKPIVNQRCASCVPSP